MPITRTSSFPTNVILSDALGTPAAPTSYFGFANAVGTQVASTGPRIQSGSGNPNGTLTSPIGSQWTDSSSGLIYTNTDGATAWIVSGNATRDWFPLLTQSPLNAQSDYFSAAVLDPKWTAWNPGANTTSTTSQATRLNMVQTTHAGVAIGGIFQPVPASTRYCVTASVRLSSRAVNVSDCGILIGGNLVGLPATAPLITWEQVIQAVPSCSISYSGWTDYATFNATPFTIASLGQGDNLLRVFVDTVGATFSFLSSSDGWTWTRWTTAAFAATTIGAAPTVIGLCVDNQASGADVNAYAAMFRVDATTDPFLPCGGFA